MILEPQAIKRDQVCLGLSSHAIWAAGPIDILRREKIGCFCSSRCPGSVILKTFDLTAAWRDQGQLLAGGFHSSMEQECFGILLRGRQPILWLPARSISGMHLKPELRGAFDAGRLLILSRFDSKQKRITAALAQQRNELLLAISEVIFVAHAAPGSRTMELCRRAARQEKLLLTIDDPANRSLFELGAKVATPEPAGPGAGNL